jgi:hypothetical protein
VEEFIEMWNCRNQLALSLSENCRKRVAIVSYEDLVQDPRVFEDACRFVEVNGKYLFRSDRKLGTRLPQEIQTKICRETGDTWEVMQNNRTFRATGRTITLAKVLANLKFRIRSLLPG